MANLNLGHSSFPRDAPSSSSTGGAWRPRPPLFSAVNFEAFNSANVVANGQTNLNLGPTGSGPAGGTAGTTGAAGATSTEDAEAPQQSAAGVLHSQALAMVSQWSREDNNAAINVGADR